MSGFLKKRFLGLLFIWAGYYFVSQTVHYDKAMNDYKGFLSVLHADPGGYYLYLPIWFIYGNDESKYPKVFRETIDTFAAPIRNGKTYTKYPCGVALLSSPFFLVAHAYCKFTGQVADGFSWPYHFGVRLSAVFYLLLGLYFLFKFLRLYYSSGWCLLACVLVIWATNCWYYVFKSPGYSHIYSFALIAAALYFLESFHKKRANIFLLGLAVVLPMIVMVRPLNGLFLILIPFWNSRSISDFVSNIKSLAHPKFFLLPFFIVSILVVLPQLFFWHDVTGHWFLYSYGNEHFSNLYHPRFYLTFLSTNNGLLPSTPIYLLTIIGMVYSFFLRKQNATLVLMFFIFFSFICASWWSPEFGCSFGQRCFLDYTPLFILPAIGLLRHVMMKGHWAVKYSMLLFIVSAVFYTSLLGSKWPGCYFGWGDYDFEFLFKVSGIIA